VNTDTLIDRLDQLIKRIQTYPWWVVLVEFIAVWAMVYIIMRFLHGTRGARVIKGVALILIISTLTIRVLGSGTSFERLNFLYSNFLGYATLAMLIVFQPELRRGLVRLGETRFFRGGNLRRARVIEELLAATAYLSKNKVGALIAIERNVGLGGIVEDGTRLNAEVSKELLSTIFWPGSALHDMGMVIQGNRVAAAGVQFPLAEGEQFSSELGSRHRAAIGLSQDTDALIIVVSEETGTISLAERSQLVRNLSISGLRTLLVRGLEQMNIPSEPDTDSKLDATQTV